jgi:ELWxxDGT repeat protein
VVLGVKNVFDRLSVAVRTPGLSIGVAAIALTVAVAPANPVKARVEASVDVLATNSPTVDSSSVAWGTLARGTQQLTNLQEGAAGSAPQTLVELGNKAVFFADDGVHGTELWVTDGTANGTMLLKDIAPGPNSAFPAYTRELVVMGGRAYFAATSGDLDHALWSTDGTTEGTGLVHQFTVNFDDCPPSEFAAVGSRIFFTADDVDTGCELWTSDGTTAGTRLVKDVVPGGGGSRPREMTAAGGRVVFAADDVNGEAEVWSSDGTAIGTSRLANLNPTPGESSYPYGFVSFGSGTKAAFMAFDGSGTAVFVSDGTSGGTQSVSDVGFGAMELVATESAVYFTGTNACSADPSDQCSFVQTSTGGASTIIDESLVNYMPIYLTSTGDKVFFVQGTAGTPGLFTVVGGTTRAVTNLRPGLFDYPQELQAVNGELYFTADVSGFGSQAIRKIWVTDGTDAGTRILKEFDFSREYNLLATVGKLGNRALLSVFTRQHGLELWVSDGTSVGTTLVEDINTGFVGIDAYKEVLLGEHIVYSNFTSDLGRELWATHVGTGATTLVKDIFDGGSSEPEDLTVLGSNIIFSAEDDLYGREVWISDGSAAGTRLLKDISTTGSSFPTEFVAMGNKVYFFANDDVAGSSLWSTDGTTGGTSMLESGFDAGIDIVSSADTVFYVVQTGSNYELMSLQGGTSTMLWSNPLIIRNMLTVDDKLFFTSDDGYTGVELWVVDGAASPTLVKDINVNSTGYGGTLSSDPFNLTAMGSRVIFGAADETYDFEPWITDGTDIGTVKIKDINPNWGSLSDPEFGELAATFAVTESGSRAYFFANDGESGRELWTTDGTLAGTRLVEDVVPGEEGVFGRSLVAIDERVMYLGNDSNVSTSYSQHTGSEIWVSDGTTDGTHIVRNIAAGSQSSYPTNFVVAGDRLIFAATPYDGGGRQFFITDGSRSSINNLERPVRILDTRSGSKVGALDGSGAAFTLQVTGRAGVPVNGVAAVAMNVTAVSTEATDVGGFVTVYPCGSRPDASNLNFVSNQIVPNAVIAPVSANGTVCFYVYGRAHLLADVSGWLPSGGFTALSRPERLLDTRPAGNAGKVGALDGSGVAYTLQVAGRAGLPSRGIGSVALNVTVVDGSTNDFGGFVTVYPCGSRPDASSLNFVSNQIVPNAVIAPVSANGTVCFYVYGKAHLLADVSGYLAS